MHLQKPLQMNFRFPTNKERLERWAVHREVIVILVFEDTMHSFTDGSDRTLEN